MAERRDEGVLARWSRRKQAARAGEPEDESQTAMKLPAEGIGQAQEARPEAPAVEDPPDLPDPATLEASSDFKPFLRPGVPVETHRAALRQLWRLDPFYSRHDGLSDYCEDFTDQAALEGVRTAWRVGRGLLDQVDKAAEPAPQTAITDTTAVESPPDPREPPAERPPTEARADPGARTGPRTRRPLPKLG
jgi:hypothetical protein